MLNNLLTEVFGAKARTVIYLIVTFALLVFTAWQGAEGDWGLAAGALIVSLSSAMSASNTPPPAPKV